MCRMQEHNSQTAVNGRASQDPLQLVEKRSVKRLKCTRST